MLGFPPREWLLRASWRHGWASPTIPLREQSILNLCEFHGPTRIGKDAVRTSSMKQLEAQIACTAVAQQKPRSDLVN